MSDYVPIKDLLSEKISGEWGIDPVSDQSTRVIRTTNFTNNGTLNLAKLALRDISESKVNSKKLIPGDVIIEKSGGSPTQPVGRVVYFDVNDGKDYLCNNFTSILRPSNKIFPKYLFYGLYFLHLSKKTLAYQNKTTGIINLQLDRYLLNEKLIVPLIDEQKRIVHTLDQADSLRQRRKQAIDLLDEYQKATFHKMFGDPIINDKNWKRVKFSDLLLTIESGRSPVCLNRPTTNAEWGVLKLGAITKCIYKSYENKALTDKERPNPSLEVRPGDVLFSRKNTYELVAACAYVWDTPPRLMLPDLIFRFAIKDKNELNPIYLQSLLSNVTKRKSIQKLAGGAAGSMPNISKSKLLDQLIELPPINLQQQYAEIVTQTEILRQKMLVQTKELEHQFNALMQKSFTPYEQPIV